MVGKPSTVKLAPLLAIPLTVTITFPVVAPVGTVATIKVALQFADRRRRRSVECHRLVPCVEPKFDPVIVTDAPTAPLSGNKLVMLGVGITVKPTPLLLTPFALTTTLPVVAPVGTAATIDVALQLPIVVLAVVPLNVTEPVP